MKYSTFSLFCICLFVSHCSVETDGLPTGNDRFIDQLKRSDGEVYGYLGGRENDSGKKEEKSFQWDDMDLDEDQWEALRSLEFEDANELGKRKAVKSDTKRWPNNQIPYVVASTVEDYSDYGDRIDEIIAYYENRTCLDFIKHTTAPSGGYVNVQSGNGCSSKIGYMNKPRNLNLKLGSCRSKIAHEFGHAIGFKHEFVRPDRDDYITVRTDNILSGYEGSFTKTTTTYTETFNIPYDYASVMGYKATSYSSNGEPTMVPNNPMDIIDMGSTELPTFRDIKLINLMYDCNSGCSESITCENEGYQGKDCTCVCPPAWTGSNCSTAVTLPDDCKNEIVGGNGTVTSENYPNNYPAEHTCQWYFKGTTAGQTITITFVDFTLEDANSSGDCDDDYLEIRTTDLFYGGDRFCGTSLPSTQTVTSASDPPEMLLFFSTDGNSIVQTGFNFTYSIA